MNGKQMDEQVQELVKQIRPILADRAPEVQSATLADLLAIWVLGFQIPGDVELTIELQARQFDRHMQLVCDLIHVQAEWAREQVLRRN
jgi:hypothetical protein